MIHLAARAIRGAVQVAADTHEEIEKATVALVREVLRKNGLDADGIEALFFTVTPDLTANIPPLALVEEGSFQVPSLCAAEPRWDGEMPRVIRVMAFVRKDRGEPIEHVYLNGTAATRP
ncbi:chorismate mutase [Streptomyces nitrosporeus]|uniref:chorismate mutase n=1 Tax=Streptomyces nitrosporeus TaxID=28894 RepID=UPI00198C1232|nr:chorismate mutase [Streptomyces nitrosporeus]GGZ18687.1 chorismate mutase [Streptomyces nitrosporeus]